MWGGRLELSTREGDGEITVGERIHGWGGLGWVGLWGNEWDGDVSVDGCGVSVDEMG